MTEADDFKRLTCLFCRHYFLDTGEQDWSEVTPGFDMEMGCRRDYWKLRAYHDSQADFRRKMLTAETCADFEPHPPGDRP